MTSTIGTCVRSDSILSALSALFVMVMLVFSAGTLDVGETSAAWNDTAETNTSLSAGSFTFRTSSWWGAADNPNWGTTSSQLLRDRNGENLGWDWPVTLGRGDTVGFSQTLRARGIDDEDIAYTVDANSLGVRHTLDETPEWLSWAVYRATSETCLRDYETLTEERPDLLIASGSDFDDFVPGPATIEENARRSLCLVLHVDESIGAAPQDRFMVYLDITGRSHPSAELDSWNEQVEAYATIGIDHQARTRADIERFASQVEAFRAENNRLPQRGMSHGERDLGTTQFESRADFVIDNNAHMPLRPGEGWTSEASDGGEWGAIYCYSYDPQGPWGIYTRSTDGELITYDSEGGYIAPVDMPEGSRNAPTMCEENFDWYIEAGSSGEHNRTFLWASNGPHPPMRHEPVQW